MTSAVQNPPAASSIDAARTRLHEALEERDHARAVYEASIGTTSELGAYVRLRAAGKQVAAADKWLRWGEGDFIFPPPSEREIFA